MRGIVLLLAAGEGTRLGTPEPKAFLDVAGTPVIRRAFEAAMGAELVDGVVVAAPPGHERRVEALVPPDGSRSVVVVSGGASRQASAAAAMAAAGPCDAFLIHDAARALAPSSLFDAVLRELDLCDAVVPGRPVTDTIKQTADDAIVSTLDRSSLVAVETPQGIRADVYRRALDAAAADGFTGTDDASLVERLGVHVRVIASTAPNPKITHPLDVVVAEALLGAERAD
jgi:2-C-methyl-D-erythritol 4-phosphate cytidylyltransferase